MRLFIVRHAPAGDKGQKAAWMASGKPDSQRPLSKEGREKMERAAWGLAEAAGAVDLIATSPYDRALQTAEILRGRLPVPLVKTDSLTPEADPPAFAAWLKTRRERSILAVGHEPHLSCLIAWLCVGKAAPFMELKKGQACLLEVAEPMPGGARMVWSLTPAQLRRLGK